MPKAARQTAKLLPREPQPGMLDEYIISGDQTTIGRHPSNDIVLSLDSISRFHARLDKRGDFHVVQDLNSSNGSMVNGERVTQMAIHTGDLVTFGNVEFEFSFEGGHQADNPATSVVGMNIVDFDDDHSATSEQSVLLPQEVMDRAKSSVVTTSADRKVDKATLFKLNQRLSSLYRLSELLRSLDVDREEFVLQKVLEVIFVAVHADRGVILTRFSSTASDLDVTAVKYRDVPIVPQKVKVSRTILNKVLNEKVAVLSRDAQVDERFNASDSIFTNQIRSTVCAPMIVGEEVLGAIHLDTMRLDKAFNQEDLEFVTIVATEVGVAVAHMRMQKQANHHARLAAVGETVAGISHNVKNILLLSQGGAELLSRALKKQDLDGANDAWQVVSRGIEKIGKLVRDMLEYSSHSQADFEMIDVNEAICETAEEVEEQLVKKGVTLELDLDETIGKRKLDGIGLQRTLMNLIVNAMEAITHSSGQIIVSTGLSSEDGLVITLKDNGAGIPADKLEKIFFPFFTTKGSAGTGLGLSMCKKCIEDMQGTLRCESEENVGTTFIIQIPNLDREKKATETD